MVKQQPTFVDGNDHSPPPLHNDSAIDSALWGLDGLIPGLNLDNNTQYDLSFIDEICGDPSELLQLDPWPQLDNLVDDYAPSSSSGSDDLSPQHSPLSSDNSSSGNHSPTTHASFGHFETNNTYGPSDNGFTGQKYEHLQQIQMQSYPMFDDKNPTLSLPLSSKFIKRSPSVVASESCAPTVLTVAATPVPTPQTQLVFVMPGHSVPVVKTEHLNTVVTLCNQTMPSTVISSSSSSSLSSKNARALVQPYPQIRPKSKLSPRTSLIAEPLTYEQTFMPLPPTRATPTFCPNPKPVYSKEDDSNCTRTYQTKREQRKIRNREAAQQSRQRRKEFIESLQEKYDRCSRENEHLKRENAHLRERIKLIENEQQNRNLKSESRPFGFRSPAISKTTGVCLLVIMMFFVFNTGSLLNRFTPSQLSSPSSLGYEVTGFHGRSLMSFDEKWAETDRVDLDKTTRVKRSSTVGNGTKDCRHLFNQTESLRLNDELSSLVQRHQKVRNAKGGQNETSKSTETTRRHKTRQEKKRKKLEKAPADMADFLLSDPNNKFLMGPRLSSYLRANKNKYDLQPYATPEVRYARLMDALQRRDDTFYLVSFKDYLLLPATMHNSTMRPRLSLVVPALPLNQSTGDLPPGFVPMMRIECEVTGTGLLQLPEYLLRSGQRRNSTHEN